MADSCWVHLISKLFSVLIFTPVLHSRGIKARGGIDSCLYSALDEWNMNQPWQLAELWQEDRRGGWALSRLIGKLAGRRAAGLRWCLLLGGAAQCRMKHEDRRQRSGQLRRWAGVGCDHRHCECEDLLKEIEEGGEKMRCGCIILQLLRQQRKEKRDLPSCVSLLPQWRSKMQKKKILCDSSRPL